MNEKRTKIVKSKQPAIKAVEASASMHHLDPSHMKENQHIEWKESWRDEYLKWISGFANAEGGLLVIGRNNAGEVVGVKDAARLLEELPNKVRDVLGILVNVNLRRKAGREYIEIAVDAYPNPISCRGEYYFRSGSTNQLLKGAALDRFLLRKHGRTWDGVPVPHVGLSDLSHEAISIFRKLAMQSRRIDARFLEESDVALMEKLNLTEKSYLKRAALLLFHSDPERFVTGAFVKIGFFQTASELLYHDEIHGDLFTQSQKTMDVLLTKYLKAAISYRGIHRVESLPVPEKALREAVLNAIIHRDYAIGAPIQIRVHADHLAIWNPGELPEHWSLAKLLKQHSSQPFNPLVANAFFRAGEIEAWGRGIERIFDACREAGSPKPRLRYEPGDLWIEFPFSSAYLEIIPSPDSRRETKESQGESSVKTSVKTSVKILELLARDPDLTLAEIAAALGRSVRAVELASAKLVKEGRLRHVGPRKGGRWEVLN